MIAGIMNNYERKAISDILKRWSKGKDIVDLEEGICENLYLWVKGNKIFNNSDKSVMPLSYFLVKQHSKSWPKFSGDVDYPVPCTTSRVTSPSKQYYSECGKWNNTQGKLRKELCAHIAAKLDAIIAEKDNIGINPIVEKAA